MALVKCAASLVFLIFVSGAGSVFGGVRYQSLSAEGIVVTGVRSDSATTDSIVLTGFYTALGSTTAALYQGSLAGAVTATIGGWNLLTPVFAGQTVSSPIFYGPNTPLFAANIPSGEVRAVGSYKYTEGASGPNADHGMIYVGPVDGSGSWTQLDATSLVAEGALLNTIAHSTMGRLVVGNDDTSLATGLAFIYDLETETWTNLAPGGTASVTAYGIWQNSENS